MGIIFFDKPRHFLEADTFCLPYNPWCLHTLVWSHGMSLPISTWPLAQDAGSTFFCTCTPACYPHQAPDCLQKLPINSAAGWKPPSLPRIDQNLLYPCDCTLGICYLETLVPKWLTLLPCRVGGELGIIPLVADGNRCAQHLKKRCTHVHSAEVGTFLSSIHAQNQKHCKSIWKVVIGVGG